MAEALLSLLPLALGVIVAIVGVFALYRHVKVHRLWLCLGMSATGLVFLVAAELLKLDWLTSFLRGAFFGDHVALILIAFWVFLEVISMPLRAVFWFVYRTVGNRRNKRAGKKARAQ